MFEIMAGVRGDNPLFKPKGLPANMGSMAEGDYYLFISSEDDEEKCVSPVHAESYVRRGLSHYKVNSNGKASWVSDPDAHTPSWLSTWEFDLCIQQFAKRAEGKWFVPTEYKAALGAMKELPQARLVFWFDN